MVSSSKFASENECNENSKLIEKKDSHLRTIRNGNEYSFSSNSIKKNILSLLQNGEISGVSTVKMRLADKVNVCFDKAGDRKSCSACKPCHKSCFDKTSGRISCCECKPCHKSCFDKSCRGCKCKNNQNKNPSRKDECSNGRCKSHRKSNDKLNCWDDCHGWDESNDWYEDNDWNECCDVECCDGSCDACTCSFRSPNNSCCSGEGCRGGYNRSCGSGGCGGRSCGGGSCGGGRCGGGSGCGGGGCCRAARSHCGGGRCNRSFSKGGCGCGPRNCKPTNTGPSNGSSCCKTPGCTVHDRSLNRRDKKDTLRIKNGKISKKRCPRRTERARQSIKRKKN